MRHALVLPLLGSLLAASTASAQVLDPLPPVQAGDPLDTVYYADRIEAERLSALQSQGADSTLIDHVLIQGVDFSSSSGLNEFLQYQLPSTYDPLGAPIPLVVAYHGFGMSDGSVADASTLDEECETRGWAYLAPTGIDDQVFGSVPGQEHVLASIEWMLSNFAIDPERIYMVGFSMGGGVCANFAARHRDPQGVMIAAVGMVSSTMDWELEHWNGPPGLKTLLEHPLNFGGPPATNGFEYHRSSTIVWSGYPPLPGFLLPPLSMGTNLGSTPVYMTYDVDDGITYLPQLNQDLFALLGAIGGTAEIHPVSGSPVPHSWSVLDEVDLFDFFEGKTAQRTPPNFLAQLDRSTAVSWAEVVQSNAGAFSYVDGLADGASGLASLDLRGNVSSATLSASAAGIAAAQRPRITLSADAGVEPTVRLRQFANAPSYLLNAISATLIPGVDSDPFDAALLVPVAAGSTLDVEVVHEANWTSLLSSSPAPAPIGLPVQIDHDGPAGSLAALLVISASETLQSVAGSTLLATLAPPVVIELLGVDAAGDGSLGLAIPNDAALSGVRLPLQSAAVDLGGQIASISNLWGFRIQ